MFVDSLQSRSFVLGLLNCPFSIRLRDNWIVCRWTRADPVEWSALICYRSNLSTQFAVLRRSARENRICRCRSSDDGAPESEKFANSINTSKSQKNKTQWRKKVLIYSISQHHCSTHRPLHHQNHFQCLFHRQYPSTNLLAYPWTQTRSEQSKRCTMSKMHRKKMLTPKA